MALYLWQVSYTAEGSKGLLKDGGSKRRQVVTQIVEKAGGKLHALYFAFGDADSGGDIHCLHDAIDVGRRRTRVHGDRRCAAQPRTGQCGKEALVVPEAAPPVTPPDPVVVPVPDVTSDPVEPPPVVAPLDPTEPGPPAPVVPDGAASPLPVSPPDWASVAPDTVVPHEAEARARTRSHPRTPRGRRP